MTDTDTDIEMTREAIADDVMHASPRVNSLEEINALWHLCSRVLAQRGKDAGTQRDTNYTNQQGLVIIREICALVP